MSTDSAATEGSHEPTGSAAVVGSRNVYYSSAVVGSAGAQQRGRGRFSGHRLQRSGRRQRRHRVFLGRVDQRRGGVLDHDEHVPDVRRLLPPPPLRRLAWLRRLRGLRRPGIGCVGLRQRGRCDRPAQQAPRLAALAASVTGVLDAAWLGRCDYEGDQPPPGGAG